MTDFHMELLGRPEIHRLLNAFPQERLALVLLEIHDFPLWQKQLSQSALAHLLELVQSCINSELPEEAMAGWWGEATFAIVCPEAPLWRAEDIAIRMQRSLETMSLPQTLAFCGLDLIIDYGCASLPPQERWQLVAQAEQELIVAGKQGGLTLPHFSCMSHVEQASRKAVFSLANQLLNHGNVYLKRQTQMTMSYAMIAAHRLGLRPHEAEDLRLAAALADLAMPEAAGEGYNRPGPLTIGEWKNITRHPTWAAELASGINLCDFVVQAVYHHHEHLDGSGYPVGLKGSDIPVGAAILGAAQAYAALQLSRPYRPARSLLEAREEMRRMGQWAFCPDVVRAVITNQ